MRKKFYVPCSFYAQLFPFRYLQHSFVIVYTISGSRSQIIYTKLTLLLSSGEWIELDVLLIFFCLFTAFLLTGFAKF